MSTPTNSNHPQGTLATSTAAAAQVDPDLQRRAQAFKIVLDRLRQELNSGSQQPPASTGHSSNAQQASNECPVCMEELVEPKLLHCGHNLCGLCGAKLATDGPKKRLTSSGSIGNSGSVQKELECLQCRSVTSVPEGGLKTNFALRDAIKRENATLRNILDQQLNSGGVADMNNHTVPEAQDWQKLSAKLEMKAEEKRQRTAKKDE